MLWYGTLQKTDHHALSGITPNVCEQLLQQTIIILLTVYYITFVHAYINRYIPFETLNSLPAGTPKSILMRKVSLIAIE